MSWNGDIKEMLTPVTLGAMRFPDRASAHETVAACLEAGVNYVDCSPAYCRKSDEENSEVWVGEALAGYRERMMLSTKCSPGNGGLEIGEEFKPQTGFGVRSAAQLKQVMEQSLQRTGASRFDCYHLWTVHNMTQFNEACKPGGWLEGACAARKEGIFRHLGVTTHADPATIIEFLETGYFEMVTLPYHLLDTSREAAVAWAGKHGIAVLAMNPLAGGMLAGSSDRVAETFADMGTVSPTELALRFVLSTPGMTSALCGMTGAEQVRTNTAIARLPRWNAGDRAEVIKRFRAMGGREGAGVCTGCRYCDPCPINLDIPRILSMHNAYYALGLRDDAIKRYKGMAEWSEDYRASRCTACGTCETRCPNALPVPGMMRKLADLAGTLAEG